jgi:Kef-type K+ transport system membrane component KefB
MALEESSIHLVHVIISLAILLFAAKLFAALFHKLKLPTVLGELLAGILVGPRCLRRFGSLCRRTASLPDETIRDIGGIAAIVILFVAGLEITPREFSRGGAASFTVGTLGVILPFFAGFAVLTVFGLNALESMLVATALTATSITITVQVLTELGKMQTREARLILGAAIVDDILAIAILSVVTTMVQTSDTSPRLTDVIFLILPILGLFAALLIGSVFLIPRLLHVERLMEI